MRKFLHKIAHHLGMTRGTIVVYEEWGHSFMAYRCAECKKLFHVKHMNMCGCDKDTLSIN